MAEAQCGVSSAAMQYRNGGKTLPLLCAPRVKQTLTARYNLLHKIFPTDIKRLQALDTVKSHPRRFR
jgi:hypothetical protein